MIAVTLEGLKLADPIDDASTHGFPFIAVLFLDDILTVAMTNAIFWQEIVAIGIRFSRRD